eukprot:TRINITY_DN16589_c0_g3_i1.p1 TRINITY_DN16589_c0_g3~~TRINITY_DN16589_c0_g3_i1.p1  ORF type:complete len:977 (+),score=352.58 TRINITY_DN16589_c0_g3_i1:98-3028(+)
MSPGNFGLAVCILFAGVSGVLGVSIPAKLLGEEDKAIASRRSKLEAWCQQELESQDKQRKELVKLRDDMGAGEDDVDEMRSLMPQILLQAGTELITGINASATEEENLDLEVKCLKQVEAALQSKDDGGRRWFFVQGESRGLRAVRSVLQQAQEHLEHVRAEQPSNKAVAMNVQDPTQEIEAAKAKLRKFSDATAERRASVLASRSGRQVLDTALAETEAALSDAAGICGLGRSVLGRIEESARPLVEQAMELIGRVEGAEKALKEVASHSRKQKAEQRSASEEEEGVEEASEEDSEAASETKAAIIQQAFQQMLAQASPQRNGLVVLKVAPPGAQGLQVQQAEQTELPLAMQQQLEQSRPPLAVQQQSMPLQQQAMPLLPVPQENPQESPLIEQLKQQQQQLQQQLQELKQVKAAPVPATPAVAASPEPDFFAAAPRPALAALEATTTPFDALDFKTAATSAPSIEVASAHEEPSHSTVAKEPEAVASPRKPAISLAAEADAEIKKEAVATKSKDKAKDEIDSLDKIDQAPVSKAEDSAEVHPHHHADTPAIVDDAAPKSHMKEEVEEKTETAPSSFPASLRGGWQGLLAKKREENKGKPKKPDQASAIMELMQTPTTYTAWTPDKGSNDSPSSDKAKAELLAAEKAFDSDDDDEPKDKKASARSLLQLDDGLGWKKLDEDLGGSDPLSDAPSFFQFGTDVYSAPDVEAANEVLGIVLDKFAQTLGSMALLELSKSSLKKDDLEHLLAKGRLSAEDVEEQRDEKAWKMCASRKSELAEAAQKELEEEGKAYLRRAEARAEAKVLRHEVSARQRLAETFGQSSQSLLSLRVELQKETSQEHELLDRIHKEVDNLSPAATADSDGVELHNTLASLAGFENQGGAALSDAIASAAARRAQAEKSDQRQLADLQTRIAELDKRGLEPQGAAAVLAAAESQHLDEMCSITSDRIKTRLAKQEGEKLALRTALSVLEAAAH